MIWRNPGFPSLLVTYGVSNDFFISGHTAIAVLGAIAASKLGPDGGRVILLGAHAGVSNANAFAAGYREAMFFGAGFAVLGALVSLIRERRSGPALAGARPTAE